MKTLKEFNIEKRRQFGILKENPHQNGIICPECGAELWDSFPGTVLSSYPPQMDIHCEKCGYKGYRLV